jgi:hypothetical protein
MSDAAPLLPFHGVCEVAPVTGDFMRVQAGLLTVMTVLAGCATPSQRISSRLIEYGVPQPQAVCVGDKLEDRLSISQMQRIGQIAKRSRNDAGQVTITQFAQALDKPGDEALVAEVVRAGLGCLL